MNETKKTILSLRMPAAYIYGLMQKSMSFAWNGNVDKPCLHIHTIEVESCSYDIIYFFPKYFFLVKIAFNCSKPRFWFQIIRIPLEITLHTLPHADETWWVEMWIYKSKTTKKEVSQLGLYLSIWFRYDLTKISLEKKLETPQSK